MYCVGLTGNIASGKTTALNYFADLGISTISADAIARQIPNSEPAVLQAIQDYFGSQVITPSGELDRRALRQIIFTNPEQRAWLEKLLHPRIKKQIQHQITQVNSPYCVIEIPLLFNREDFPYLNRILLIVADQAISCARIMARDQCSDAEAMAIINSQPNEEFRKQLADDVLFNNQNPDNLKHNIQSLHALYLRQAELFR